MDISMKYNKLPENCNFDFYYKKEIEREADIIEKI